MQFRIQWFSSRHIWLFSLSYISYQLYNFLPFLNYNFTNSSVTSEGPVRVNNPVFLNGMHKQLTMTMTQQVLRDLVGVFWKVILAYTGFLYTQ